MLQKFELRGVHMTVDEALQKYATKKLANLDKYLPRDHRDSVHCVVELKQAAKAKENKRYTCAVTLHLRQGDIVASESTLNMYAAVDIVEARLRLQIKKYKESHVRSGKLARHLTARFRRRSDLAVPEVSAE